MRRLDDPHVAPLNAMVRRINAQRSVDRVAPWFDPADGGVDAAVLILLECPGPQASAHKGSGPVSADNDDTTAANIYGLLQESGLARRDIVIWNVVPVVPAVQGRQEDQQRDRGGTLLKPPPGRRNSCGTRQSSRCALPLRRRIRLT